jgi:hypothetical protein
MKTRLGLGLSKKRRPTGAGPGPGIDHPLAGSEFDWVSAEHSPLYDDLAWSDQIAGETDDRINSIGPAESGLRHWRLNTSAPVNELFFADGASARAINGKPVLYQTGDRRAVLRNAANNASEQVQNWISTNDFNVLIVARRADDNGSNSESLFAAGSNTPGPIVLNAQDIGTFRHFNDALNARFVTFAWPNGSIQVLAARWNDSTSRFEVSVNGGAWATSASTSAWSPAGKTGTIVIGASQIADLACAGVFAGDKGREWLESKSAELMEYYGIS